MLCARALLYELLRRPSMHSSPASGADAFNQWSVGLELLWNLGGIRTLMEIGVGEEGGVNRNSQIFDRLTDC